MSFILNLSYGARLSAAAFLYFLFLSALPVVSQPGAPDRSFGTNGRASLVADQATAILVQPDRKIVVGGTYRDNFFVARFDVHGNPDNAFGSGGGVVADFGGDDIITAMVLQPDGKIIVAGNSSSGLAMVRYNANGTPDNSFGDGGRYEIGTGRGSGTFDEGFAMALQSDGKIVVAYPVDVSGRSDIVVMRLLSAGMDDNTFGQRGTTKIDFGDDDDDVNHLLIQEDGKIVLTGRARDEFAVARLLSNGSPDSTFSSDGIRVHQSGSAPAASIRQAAMQPDGKIVAAGVWRGDVALVRYLPDGSSDPSFGTNAMVRSRLRSTLSEATALVLQPDGKIVVAAAVGTVGFPATDVDVALIRYNPDGTPDELFGTGGVAYTDIDDIDYPTGIALQGDGKILLCGRYGSAFGFSGIVLRYHNDNTTGVPADPGSGVPVAVVPNPVTHDFVLEFSVASDNAIVSAALYTVAGVPVRQVLWSRRMSSGNHRERVAVPDDVPAGVYVMAVDINGQRNRIKLLVR